MSRFELNEEEMSGSEAARFIQDELLLDGTPALNLAGFATTYMESEVEDLMLKNLPKNITHRESYPASYEIENRCINIIARLFNAPLANQDSEAIGLSTLGSSEAVFVAIFAAKRRWQNARRVAGKPYDRPNVVMHSNVHVCWKKAALYLEVENRYCVSSADRYTINAQEAVANVDENTILVCAILGSTFTGEYEDVQALTSTVA